MLQEKYPYFVPRRDGTGSGGTGGGSDRGQPAAGKVFQGGNREPTDTELMQIMGDPKALNSMFQELSRI